MSPISLLISCSNLNVSQRPCWRLSLQPMAPSDSCGAFISEHGKEVRSLVHGHPCRGWQNPAPSCFCFLEVSSHLHCLLPAMVRCVAMGSHTGQSSDYWLKLWNARPQKCSPEFKFDYPKYFVMVTEIWLTHQFTGFGSITWQRWKHSLTA